MLMPKKVRHRKAQRGRMSGTAKGGTRVHFGDYGIQALEPGWITNRQIEAARIAMTRYIKRGGKVWINIFPDKPVTQKPAETRMGSGKGRGGEAGPGHVRAVGRARGRRPGRDAPRNAQAPDQDALRVAPGGGMTRARELRELNEVELEHRLSEAKEELFNLRFQNATGQLDNSARLGQVRKDIARVETLLREHEIAAAEALGIEQETEDA